jgi:uncharacterized GH25 family protein
MIVSNLRYILCLSVLAASTGVAHDFWIQPQQFQSERSATVPFKLKVGHESVQQRSPIALRRIDRFDAIAPDGTRTDIRAGLRRDSDNDGSLSFASDGTYVLVLTTDDRAQTVLPTSRYKEYALQEGLESAYEKVASRAWMLDTVTEIYSRQAKALVQVGAAKSAAAYVTNPVGMQLEIVPEVNPFAEPRPTSLPVRVLFEGRALTHALVKLRSLDPARDGCVPRWTDLAGRAVFAMPRAGAWRLTVTWTTRLAPTDAADFESEFASLTFGFDANRVAVR